MIPVLYFIQIIIINNKNLDMKNQVKNEKKLNFFDFY